MSALKFFLDLQQAMDKQAKDVWDMVQYSRSAGNRLRLGEVTLTELNFYRLRNHWTRGVFINTNEPDEPTTGADWEWLVGYDETWIQIRVQAKIISRTRSFSEIGHETGTQGRQIDNLITPDPTSTYCRWLPLYVFYAATPPAPAFPQNNSPADRRFGCSAQTATHVREIYDGNPNQGTLRSSAHLPGSIPWSHVFSGLTRRLSAGEDIHDVIDGLANQMLPSPIADINHFWDPSISDGPCTPEKPDYLQAILEPGDDDFTLSKLATLTVKVPKTSSADSKSKAREDRGENIGKGEDGSTVPKSIAEGFESLPTRTLDYTTSSATKIASLPRLVSVINVDDLE